MDDQVSQHERRESQPDAARLDVGNGVGESRSVWLSAREAAIYVGNKSVAAFYVWRRTKGLVANGRGFYARRDLDKAMAIPRKRHVMSSNSLKNLRRHGSQVIAAEVSRQPDFIRRKDGE